MTVDETTIAAIADAVAERLRPTLPPPGWPDGRGCVTEPELAQYLAVSQDFVRGLRRAKKIGCTLQGRRVTYSVGDVVEYLATCRSRGDPEH